MTLNAATDRPEIPLSPEITTESVLAKIELTAKPRVQATRDYFARAGLSFDNFLQELKKEPFTITIDPEDHTSIVRGIFTLQQTLGISLIATEKKYDGCDAIVGPYTYKQYLKKKKRTQSKADLKELHATLLSTTPPPSAKVSIIKEKDNTQETLQLPEAAIQKTVFIGDSLTVGMINVGGIKNSQIPPHEIQEYRDTKGRKRTREIGTAVSGQGTGAMLIALEHAKNNNELTNTQRIVIFGGVNDLASGRSIKTITDNLQAMYTIARENGISLVICTISQWDPEVFIRNWNAGAEKKHTEKIKNGEIAEGTPPPLYPLSAEELNRRTTAVNAWICKQKQEQAYPSLQVVDLNVATLDSQQFPRTKDSIHFSKDGYNNLAAYILEQGNIKIEG